MEKHFQIIKAELVCAGSLAACEDVVGQVELLLLELEDTLLHRALHHEPAANKITMSNDMKLARGRKSERYEIGKRER